MVCGANTIEEFVRCLKQPRIIILLVLAGKPVDEFIEKMVPLLDKDDIIIDAGNSDYLDTERRFKELTSMGFRFIGSGVSGGEMGARYGPSLMPGGSEDGWSVIRPIFESIAAKVGGDSCVTWIGTGGSGHYVKMVHNGIEYGDMQLICEAYHIMKSLLRLKCDEISNWNDGELQSYLIEITRDILKYQENGEFLVEKVRDVAGQKGTGKWTVMSGLDMGIPITLIAEAVFSRCLSSLKDDRTVCSQTFVQHVSNFEIGHTFIEDIKNALYASKIISYTQGFMLLQSASLKYGWDLRFGEIAMIWRGGCIIKRLKLPFISRFLSDIYKAYNNNSKLSSLIMDSYFKECIERCLVCSTVIAIMETSGFNMRPAWDSYPCNEFCVVVL
ncbi:6-phosphogluconate dehydrogenase, decarboxylating 2 [Thelohanellus kitauei]|uniref:6-phosphogluconate dehydrogenase, decarboxylating n=1 Tax=Thelohanellus kitauei TaxID=669202 RepID=A0A0C2IZI6_THEKT|nr:6-phosphogluconate dehydrogenase, decarboxylating 2 [Thelohanellus kitauei]